MHGDGDLALNKGKQVMPININKCQLGHLSKGDRAS